MDVSRFEQLIHRLEAVAARNPSGYRARVAAVALLGFVILAVVLGMALLMVGALAGVVLMLFKGGGAVALIALKLGKALILLALPLWLLLKTSFRMLLARFPAPEGLEITRADAPRLFERLDDMQRRMNGPAFHHVLLVDQLNAAVVQHPRLGLFGWNRHYLILGLPLLQTLDEDEALAVVAHEYGHLAGDHGRFGAFIYRLRGAWGQMQAMAQTWDDWGSRLVARLFGWYAPWFNAYSFVMARANEYQADRSSAELVGAAAAARALQRVGVAARFEAQDFWPGIDRLARAQAEPPAALSGEWRRALSSLDEARACSYRDEVLQESTGYGDTHPCLNDRLRALGEAPSPVLPAIGTTAAERWLGDALPRLAGVLDARWRDDVRTRWQERNSYLAERLQQLQALRENRERSVEDEWTLLLLTAELDPDVDRRPAIEALLARAPDHLAARFALGDLKLDADDAGGIDDIEAVMQADADAILAGCETIWRWLRTRDPVRADLYCERWERRQAHLAGVQHEMDTLDPKCELGRHDLSPEVEADIVRAVLPHVDRLARVFLLRRPIGADPRARAYVLAFDMTRRWLRSEEALGKLARTLAAADYPVSLHVVPLGAKAFRGWRKRIRALGVDALPLGGES